MQENVFIKIKFVFILFFLLLMSSGCQRFVQGSQLQNNHIIIPTITKQNVGNNSTKTPKFQVTADKQSIYDEKSWWISDSISEFIKNEIEIANSDMILTSKDEAVYWLVEEQILGNEFIPFEKVYVVTTPLTSLIFDIKWSELKAIWQGESSVFDNKVWVSPIDMPVLEKLFGNVISSNILISSIKPDICNKEFCIRIQGFESIEPQWRVLPINGNSPLYKEFSLNSYPLAYKIFLSLNPIFKLENVQNEIPITPIINFTKEKLTSVLLTGTTALVRNTALNIEQNGILFPGENISKILSSADFTHISNEVPFYSECPPAKPLRTEMRFCSDPKYLELFKYSGVDIVELTGNHLLDWGPDAFQETLDLYEKNDFLTYGGGRNISSAKQPVIINHNGNNLAFIGCNVAGPDNNWATINRPGASKCDFKFLIEQIRIFKQQGILPIVTLQDYEFEDFDPVKLLKDDFWKLAEAGAVIVSGSQAHFPQGIDEVNGAFIHYGLGNLFFDQMANWFRKATIDFHYFYDGRYINTTIVPIINENYGQPRLMNQDEADRFLKTIFQHSYYYSKE